MEPDPRDLVYLNFVGRRKQGQTAEEIAGALGFESARQLWERLADSGFPVCPNCGEKFPDKRHDCKKSGPDIRNGGRAREGRGETQELPDAARAVPLFEDALARLRLLAERLPRRREYRKGSRFVSDERGESVRTYSRRTKRKEMTPDEWRRICEEYHLDPDANAHEIPYRCEVAPFDAPLGIPKDHPAEPLPALVGTFALTGWDIDELIEVLHPIPDRADHQEIEKVRKGLVRQAQRLAALVRGGKAGAGKRGQGIAPAERRLAMHIRELTDRYWQTDDPDPPEKWLRKRDKWIARRLKNGGFEPLPPSFKPTPKEVRRLITLD